MSSNKLSALWLSIVDIYVHPHHLSIIFLSETMVSKKCISKVDLFLGFFFKIFFYYLCVENWGKSCGLCMFWSQNIQVIVVEFGQNLIALKYIYIYIYIYIFLSYYRILLCLKNHIQLNTLRLNTTLLEIMCRKEDVVLKFVKYINGLTSSRSRSKRIVSAQFVENLICVDL